jgi:hypothetical protein
MGEGDRANAHERPARRSLARAVPLLASVCVAVVVVAAIFAHGLTRRASSAQGTARDSSRAFHRQANVVREPACRFEQTRTRTVLPPLIKSDAAPSGSLLKQAAFFRQPSTASDRINLKTFDRWPDEVLTVYVRYMRVVTGPSGTRIAVVPSVVCACAGGKPPGPSTYPEPSPHQILLMQVLSTPGGFPRPTIDLGTAADIRRRWANGYIDNPLPRGRSGLWVSVVPDETGGRESSASPLGYIRELSSYPARGKTSLRSASSR